MSKTSENSNSKKKKEKKKKIPYKSFFPPSFRRISACFGAVRGLVGNSVAFSPTQCASLLTATAAFGGNVGDVPERAALSFQAEAAILSAAGAGAVSAGVVTAMWNRVLAHCASTSHLRSSPVYAHALPVAVACVVVDPSLAADVYDLVSRHVAVLHSHTAGKSTLQASVPAGSAPSASQPAISDVFERNAMALVHAAAALAPLIASAKAMRKVTALIHSLVDNLVAPSLSSRVRGECGAALTELLAVCPSYAEKSVRHMVDEFFVQHDRYRDALSRDEQQRVLCEELISPLVATLGRIAARLDDAAITRTMVQPLISRVELSFLPVDVLLLDHLMHLATLGHDDSHDEIVDLLIDVFVKIVDSKPPKKMPNTIANAFMTLAKKLNGTAYRDRLLRRLLRLHQLLMQRVPRVSTDASAATSVHLAASGRLLAPIAELMPDMRAVGALREYSVRVLRAATPNNGGNGGVVAGSDADDAVHRSVDELSHLLRSMWFSLVLWSQVRDTSAAIVISCAADCRRCSTAAATAAATAAVAGQLALLRLVAAGDGEHRVPHAVAGARLAARVARHAGRGVDVPQARLSEARGGGAARAADAAADAGERAAHDGARAVRLRARRAHARGASHRAQLDGVGGAAVHCRRRARGGALVAPLRTVADELANTFRNFMKQLGARPARDKALAEATQALLIGLCHSSAAVRAAAAQHVDDLTRLYPHVLWNTSCLTTLLDLLDIVGKSVTTTNYVSFSVLPNSAVGVDLPEDSTGKRQLLTSMVQLATTWLKDALHRAPGETQALLHQYMHHFRRHSAAFLHHVGYSLAVDIATRAQIGKAKVDDRPPCTVDNGATFVNALELKALYTGEIDGMMKLLQQFGDDAGADVADALEGEPRLNASTADELGDVAAAGAAGAVPGGAAGTTVAALIEAAGDDADDERPVARGSSAGVGEMSDDEMFVSLLPVNEERDVVMRRMAMVLLANRDVEPHRIWLAFLDERWFQSSATHVATLRRMADRAVADPALLTIVAVESGGALPACCAGCARFVDEGAFTVTLMSLLRRERLYRSALGWFGGRPTCAWSRAAPRPSRAARQDVSAGV
jgi:hypothetical protein